MKKNQKVTHNMFFHRAAEALFVIFAACLVVAAYIVVKDPAYPQTAYIGLASFAALGIGLICLFAHDEINRGIRVASYVNRNGEEMQHMYRTR